MDDNTNPVVGMDPYHEDDDCAVYECKFFLCNDCQPMCWKKFCSNDMINLCLHVIPDSDVKDTNQLLQNKDREVDIFLIFEEMAAVDGKAPP